MFLVSELVEGGTLKKLVMSQMMTPGSSLYSTRDAVRWCLNIADALTYIHSVKPQIIHRDLKLENILLTSVGSSTDRSKQEAKLADFGLVAFVKKTKETHVFEPDRHSLQPESSAVKVDEAVRQMQKQTSFAKRGLARTESQASKVTLTSEVSHGSLPAAKALLTGKTGTLMYMSPEMFLNKEYDEKVDVFSFAICMYEIIHKYMMVFAVSN